MEVDALRPLLATEVHPGRTVQAVRFSSVSNLSRRKGEGMSKHTPGPWEWSEDMTASVPGEVARTLDAPGRSVLYHNAGWDVTKANRDLIATAPELLRELKSLSERFRSCVIASGTDPKYADVAVENARALIAKAEGK